MIRILEDAILLAVSLHAGQKDKAGAPYVRHPLRVMESKLLRTDEERMAGVLHDVIEDCGVTARQLLTLKYPESVVEAIVCVSKLPNETGDDPNGEKYRAFICRVANGPELARRIKLADLADNMDLSRIQEPTEWDYKRQMKYRHAFSIIETTLLSEKENEE